MFNEIKNDVDNIAYRLDFHQKSDDMNINKGKAEDKRIYDLIQRQFKNIDRLECSPESKIKALASMFKMIEHAMHNKHIDMTWNNYIPIIGTDKKLKALIENKSFYDVSNLYPHVMKGNRH